ncbi:MAG: ABC transporter substrate-binding protein [Chloroflexota bacterium]|nr:MAG: ABC transporter substrate-binding protein [Chloroflexota bacterium]
MRTKLAFLLLGVAVIALLSYALGCAAFRNAPGSATTDGTIQVIATFYPLAEFARQVGQEKVTVRNLTPAGAEPHDFDPSPRDMAALQKSKVFIYNGAGFEPWVDKVLKDLPTQTVVVVDSSEGIRLLDKSSVEEGQEQTGIGSSFDPHFWLDPVLAKQQVENIKAGLIKADPANGAFYEANASAYSAKLDELDGQYRDGLAGCKRRDIVASHNAFQYLAKRYDLNVVAISGLSPDQEPSPRKLGEIVQFARANDVKYIFFETLVSPRLAETIANEIGAKTLVFNPIEGLTDEEQAVGEDYLSIQRENLENLKTALECP